jgi:translocation and assembly module TamB
MNETAASPAIALRRRHLGNGIARVVSIAGLLVILLAALAYGAVRWLDSEGGRAFVTRQLPLYAPQSGLTVRAGRIDGSIFGVAIIHDLTPGGRLILSATR